MVQYALYIYRAGGWILFDFFGSIEAAQNAAKGVAHHKIVPMTVVDWK